MFLKPGAASGGGVGGAVGGSCMAVDAPPACLQLTGTRITLCHTTGSQSCACMAFSMRCSSPLPSKLNSCSSTSMCSSHTPMHFPSQRALDRSPRYLLCNGAWL